MIDGTTPDGSAEAADGTSHEEPVETLDATEGGGEGDNGLSENTVEVPWDGKNPMELPPQLRSTYDNMSKGFYRGMEDLASQRKALESEAAGLRDKEVEVSRLLAEMRVAGAQTPQNGAGAPSGEETRWTADRLKQSLADTPADQKLNVLFDALRSEAAVEAAGVRGQYEGVIEELRNEVKALQDGIRPQQEAATFHRVFADMAGSTHRVFTDQRVKDGIKAVLDSGDPTVDYLLSLGTEDGIRAALDHAGQKARYNIDVGSITNNAKRARGGDPLNGKASVEREVTTKGPPTGSGNWLGRVQATLRKKEHASVLSALGLDSP